MRKVITSNETRRAREDVAETTPRGMTPRRTYPSSGLSLISGLTTGRTSMLTHRESLPPSSLHYHASAVPHTMYYVRGFVSSRGWVVASPPRRRRPQVRAPWRHGAMGPSTPWNPWPRPVARAAVGDAGVYTDWRKWPLDAVSGHLCTLLRHPIASDGASGAVARSASSSRRQPTQTSKDLKVINASLWEKKDDR